MEGRPSYRKHGKGRVGGMSTSVKICGAICIILLLPIVFVNFYIGVKSKSVWAVTEQLQSSLVATSSAIRRMPSTTSLFVVWMFPFPPPSTAVVPSSDDVVIICAYSNACGSNENHVSINLMSMTKGNYFSNYICDHAYHKVRHMLDFPLHIHAITMITLLQSTQGACVQTLGSRNKFCDPEQFQNYNPYRSVFLEETNFPHQILQIDGTGKEKVVSEAYFRQEDFAMWGTEDLTNDFMPYFTRYNSGEDVQSYAGAHFMPYLSEIRNKDKALVNYTGYYIGNALVPVGSTQGASESDMENIEKVSLLSIFMNEQSRDMMKTYLKLYTEKVSPFGCRSTLTLQFLKDAKIKSYFSACLTLMTSMQGTALTIPAGKNPGIGLWGMMEPNVTAMALPSQKEKTMILMIDCNNEGAIPKAVRDRAIRAGADLPGYYRSIGQKKMGRYNYSYKLLSLYANQAKVVITSRIHVGLPAAAMGVPVIFMKSANGKLPGGKQATGRVAGLLKVFHEVAPFEGKNWTFGDLTGEVPPNAGNHFADRYRASFWNNLRKTHFYRDTAKLYGMVPLQRLGMANIGGPSTQNTFHFVLQKDDLSWQTKRAIEHIFYFHPNARIYVHSNSINPEDLGIFAETGYDLIMQNYDIEELIENAFSAAIPLTQILHNRLSIYFLILWKYGGVYVSKNTMVVKELPLPLEHGVVMEEESGDPALIHLPKHSTDAHSFLMGILLKNEADQIKDWRIPVLSEEDTQKCIKDEVWSMDIANDDSVVAVSLHPTTFVSAASIKYKSVCYHVVEEFCIFCDEIHWDF